MHTNGTPRTGVQFSVFLGNKPGMLARVCQQLAEDHINIVALSMMDSTEHGVMRLVVGDPDRARHSLATADATTAESQVLLMTLPNRPGALADVVQRLAANHINVNYAYMSAGAAGGKTTGVFRVSDMRKAVQVLGERRPQRKLAVVSRAAPPARRAHA